jgi:hypothetical protein
MGGEAGNEPQVVHLNVIDISLTIPGYDLTLGLIEGEVVKGRKGLSHIPCDGFEIDFDAKYSTWADKLSTEGEGYCIGRTARSAPTGSGGRSL